jgi:DNA polymerase
MFTVNREEAVLREFNLYPLWQRRVQPAALAEAESSATPAVVEVVAPIAADTTITLSPSLAQRELANLDWPALKALVRDCTACKLRAGCTQTVFGVGDEKASWLFVGEGPGADEDAQGEPFVGQAGKLLDNMLMAIKLKRGKDVYIGNIVKCRPPGNRTPEADEIATCFPYLQRQIELIQPKIIVALGKTAATALLGKDATLASLRGRLHDYHGIPLIITYHPAYLLRTLTDKAKAWQDLCLAVKTMEG